MVYILENPIKMDDLGVPLYLETPIFFQLNKGYIEPVYDVGTKLEATGNLNQLSCLSC